MQTNKPQILLTNDDGIQSPGLWAAAEALSSLGFVHVVAPRDQYSGGGRSLPSTSDGSIQERQVQVKDKTWTVFSVGGSPAQAVLHAIFEILPKKPALVVSGINYGENLGIGITASGTVGAALEGAAHGVPSLAVSLETDPSYHFSYSEEIDFSASACVMVYFARQMLEKHLPADVDVLKIDIPSNATCNTPWEFARLSRQNYFVAVPQPRSSWKEPKPIGYRVDSHLDQDAPDTDIYVIRVKRHVAVTPLSLDMTSRVNLKELEKNLRH